MIQVGLEQVWGTVLSRSQACSGPDQGRLWTWTGNVLSMIEECFELEWGMFWAWMGMEWSRVGEGLSQDWNRTRTEPGPVPDRPGTDGDYRDAVWSPSSGHVPSNNHSTSKKPQTVCVFCWLFCWWNEWLFEGIWVDHVWCVLVFINRS